MAGEKRSAEEVTSQNEVEIASKKQKVEVNMPELIKQIHYYFSDENLQHDKFFHTTIAADSEGWLGCDKLLACKKVQALKATDADIVEAVKDSSELEAKSTDEMKFIRRKDNKSLPALLARPRLDDKKKDRNPYDGGVVIRCINVPEWSAWGDCKDAVKAKCPKDAKIAFCTSKKEGEEGEGLVVDMVINPFNGDVPLFMEMAKEELIVKEDLERKAKAAKKRADKEAEEAKKEGKEVEKKEEAVAEVKEAKTGSIKIVMLEETKLKRVLMSAPKWVNKKRDEFARAIRTKRQVKVNLGEQVFPNIQSVKSKVKEVLNARMAGQQLKVGSPDYILMQAVFKHHPRADVKCKGMNGLKVDKHPEYPEQTCFFVMREDGSSEDISVKKCIDELQVAALAAQLEAEKREEDQKKADFEKAKEA